MFYLGGFYKLASSNFETIPKSISSESELATGTEKNLKDGKT